MIRKPESTNDDPPSAPGGIRAGAPAQAAATRRKEHRHKPLKPVVSARYYATAMRKWGSFGKAKHRKIQKSERDEKPNDHTSCLFRKPNKKAQPRQIKNKRGQ
jgi:hypothetical protein